jgi:hypothetical protein
VRTHPVGSGGRCITTVIVPGTSSTTACTLPELVRVSVRQIVKPSGRTERNAACHSDGPGR